MNKTRLKNLERKTPGEGLPVAVVYEDPDEGAGLRMDGQPITPAELKDLERTRRVIRIFFRDVDEGPEKT